ncbi:YT521-B-like domain-containing protein [Geopyxis carbonaria]|nr:YT521-B-like domain-containing protein [Geopyxis carbonaria]
MISGQKMFPKLNTFSEIGRPYGSYRGNVLVEQTSRYHNRLRPKGSNLAHPYDTRLPATSFLEETTVLGDCQTNWKEPCESIYDMNGQMTFGNHEIDLQKAKDIFHQEQVSKRDLPRSIIFPNVSYGNREERNNWKLDKPKYIQDRQTSFLSNPTGLKNIIVDDSRQPKAFRRGDDARSRGIDENWAVTFYPVNKTLTAFPINARFFVIKSNCELDIFSSLKWGLWASTDLGNKRLDKAYRSTKAPIYLFFSVVGSGRFCGVAQMQSTVNLDISTGIWSERRWRGSFNVQWLYIKDIPNMALRHIRIINNENKPVSNSRDTQELYPDAGLQVLSIFDSYESGSSMLNSPVDLEAILSGSHF